MATSFSVSVSGVKGADALASNLSRAARTMGDLAPSMKRVSVVLDQWVQRNFKREGELAGGWTPFKHGGRVVSDPEKATTSRPVFVSFSSGAGFLTDLNVDESAKLLQHTGALRSSFVPFGGKDVAGIGSDLPYSKPHNEGTGVPKRRMLPEADDVRERVLDIMGEGVAAKLFKSGLK